MKGHAAVRDAIDPTAQRVPEGQAFFRRNVACVQLAFAAFWVVRGVASIGVGTPGLAVATVLAVVGTLVLATAAVRRIGPLPRPDFSRPDVRRLARRLSWATVLQLLGSTAIGAVLSSLGCDEWVVPSLVTTIGLFLVYAGRELAVALTTTLGWVMALLSILPTLILGTATSSRAATVLAIGTAVLLAASSAACFVAGWGVESAAAGTITRSAADPASRGRSR